MPAALAEVVSDFADMQGQDKLQLLLEFANELPPIPAAVSYTHLTLPTTPYV